MSLALIISTIVSVSAADITSTIVKSNHNKIQNAPKLINVSTGYVTVGDDIRATSSETGTLYLVPFPQSNKEMTLIELNEIVSRNKGVSLPVNSNVPGLLKTTGFNTGVYVVYASNLDGKITGPSSRIYLEDTAPSPTYSRIGNILQGALGTNKVSLALVINNKQSQGIGGYTSRDLKISVSENGGEFKEYRLDDSSKFSDFTASVFPIGLYIVSYQGSGPSVKLRFKDLKVEGLLVDSKVIEKTTLATNVIPSPTKSDYSITKYASSSGETLIDLTIVDINGDDILGLKASDFSMEVNGKIKSLASAPFKNFTSADGSYQVILSNPKKGNYTVKSPRVKNVLIETKRNWVPVAPPKGDRIPGVLFIDTTTAGKPGSKQDRISLHVENKKSEAISGLSAKDFSVRVNNGKKVTLAQAPFSEFKDRGRGNYEVYYNGEQDDMTYVLTEMSVGNYSPEGFYEIIKTAKPKPTKRLFIAGDY